MGSIFSSCTLPACYKKEMTRYHVRTALESAHGSSLYPEHRVVCGRLTPRNSILGASNCKHNLKNKIGDRMLMINRTRGSAMIPVLSIVSCMLWCKNIITIDAALISMSPIFKKVCRRTLEEVLNNADYTQA